MNTTTHTKSTGRSGRDTRPRLGAGEEAWDRRRLLRTLIAIAVTGLLAVSGLGYATYLALTTRDVTTMSQAGEQAADAAVVFESLPPGQVRRDAIAAAPMLTVPPQAGRAGTPAAEPAPIMEIPAAGQLGPAGVATGYPRTPQGAVGQLAAITVSVLQGMSMEHTRTVHHAWSHPDAPRVEEWELLGNVQAFLTATGGSRQHPASSWVVAVAPVAAQVKGIDGDDWVLACVLSDVEARIVTTARIGYGHCERMQWTTSGDNSDNGDDTDRAAEGWGRWVIAPGEAPARAPSTWPGTDLARQAGWLTWSPAEAGVVDGGGA